MHSIGFTELLVIFGIAVLLFGNRLPSIGKSLGEGIKNFKKGLNANDDADAQAKTPSQDVPRADAPKVVAAAGSGEASRLSATGHASARQVVDVDVQQEQK